MKKIIIKLIVTVLFLLVFVAPVQADTYYSVNVGYQGQNDGVWTDFAYGGAIAGTENGVALDNLELHLVDAPYEASIEVRVYTQSGWAEWVSDFESANTNGQDILGVQIKLNNFDYANVYYQSYRQGLGWGIWVSNGSTSGQLNSAHPITGLRVQVAEVGVEYQSAVNGVQQVLRHNGETQGTGSLETLSMNLMSKDANDKILYRAYYKSTGWSDWANNGHVIGTVGSGETILAIEAKLEGLDAYYHVAVQPQVNGEWWDWAYDGTQAGTLDKSLTAYRVKIERLEYVRPVENVTNSNDVESVLECGPLEVKVELTLGTTNYSWGYTGYYSGVGGSIAYSQIVTTDNENSSVTDFTDYIDFVDDNMDYLYMFYARYIYLSNYTPIETDSYKFCFGSSFGYSVNSGTYYLTEATNLADGPLSGFWILFTIKDVFDGDTHTFSKSNSWVDNYYTTDISD